MMMPQQSSDPPLSYDPLPEKRSTPLRRPAAIREEGRSDILPTLLRLLQRSFRKAILCAFVCAVLGGTVALFMKPYYIATSSFVPPSGGIGSGAASLLSQMSSVGGSLGGGLLGGVKSNADLYSSILKSHSVARKLVDHFDLMSLYKVKKESIAEKILASHTDVVIGVKDGIVTVRVTDDDPERARNLANYYLEALRETSYGMALSESSQQRLFFEDRLRREKDALSNAEVALKENEEKSGLIAPAGQTAVQLQAVAQFRAQMAAREVELAALRQSEAETNPDVERIKRQIQSLSAQIDQLQSGRSGRGRDSFSAAEMPALTLDYVRLQRDVKYHETLFEIIAKQYEASRISEANDPPLQTLDRATTPDIKAGPRRSLIAASCFVIGFFGFLALTVIQAIRRGEMDWRQLAQ